MSSEIVSRSAERWYPAGAARLFEAYRKRDQMLRWFGPANLAGWLKFDHDLRSGGELTFGFTTGGGQEFWGRCDFVDVDPGGRIEYVSSTTDSAGAMIRCLPPTDWLLRVHTVVSMISSGAGTILSVTVRPHEAGAQEQAFFAFKWTEMKTRFDTSFDILGALLDRRTAPGQHQFGVQ